MPKIFQNQYGTRTDIGRQRSHNEDTLRVTTAGHGELFLICDGVSTKSGGAWAAELTAMSLSQFFTEYKPDNEPISFLPNAFQYAHRRVLSEAEGKVYRGMSAAAVALWVRENKAYYAHAGDCRLYLFREGKLYRLTKDHTLAQQLLDSGQIETDEIRKHPQAQVLTQAIGFQEFKEESCVAPLELLDADQLLLCSDGLGAWVEDEAIAGILAEPSVSPQGKADLLINLANFKGGTNNISVILLEHKAEEVVEKPIKKSVSPSLPSFSIRTPAGSASFVGFLFFCCVLGWLYHQNRQSWLNENTALKAQNDSLALVKMVLFELSEKEKTRVNSIKNTHFDPYDSENYRIYGLYRDREAILREGDLAQMFNVPNANSVKMSETLGERWFVVPVKGVHLVEQGDNLTSIARRYYTHQADSVLVKKFNGTPKVGKHIFIPFGR